LRKKAIEKIFTRAGTVRGYVRGYFLSIFMFFVSCAFALLIFNEEFVKIL